ncbi:MAG: methyltransferase, partial [Pseudomonadota bacterium]|nr:methyltransferase [Pseudomonadota bacterium]
MQHRLAIALATSTVLALTACQSAGMGPVNQAAASAQRVAMLQQAAAYAGRTPANVARDRYRHPVETLSFFEVDPSDTVVEIWPGGGWYTEILAPYLAAGGGRLILGTLDAQLGGVAKLRDSNPALYANITAATFPAFDANAVRVPDGTADVVLTFRNVHNWKMGYRRDDKQDYSADAF